MRSSHSEIIEICTLQLKELHGKILILDDEISEVENNKVLVASGGLNKNSSLSPFCNQTSILKAHREEYQRAMRAWDHLMKDGLCKIYQGIS